MSAISFVSGRSAAQVDHSLRRSLAAMDEAKQCAVLWFGEVMRRGLYRKFGCSTIHQYASEKLGFSKSRTRDFVHLAKKLEELPDVENALREGKLGYTKAREVVKVATPRTQGSWLEAARKPRKELIRQVKRARKAAKTNPAQTELMPAPQPVAREIPVRLSCEFTPEQEARRAALVERLHKLGAAPNNRAELLLDALAALVAAHESEGPRGPSPSVQIHVHEHNGKLTANGRELGSADTERLKCDSVICKQGELAKATIPPRTRREVLARDRHRCQAPGCDRAHFLEIHHKLPRAKGGTHDPENLITLCASCHRLHHEKGAFVRETAEAYGDWLVSCTTKPADRAEPPGAFTPDGCRIPHRRTR